MTDPLNDGESTAEQEEQEREFEAPRNPATTPTTSKRKPRMITAADPEEATPKDNNNHHHHHGAWPYPPPPPHDYHRGRGEHPGAMYSPAYYDRSMQPPSHHSHYPYSSHHNKPRTPARASQSQSIHRTTSSDDPADDDEEDDDLEPESMETEEHEDMGTDYMGMPINVGKEMGADYLNLPVGSFADDSPPRPRKTPTKGGLDDKKRSPSSASSSVYPPHFGGGYHHPHHPHHPAYYNKSPRGSSSSGQYPPAMYSAYPPPPGSHPLPASKGAARSAHAAHPASAPPAHHHPHHYPYPPYPPHRYYPPAYPHHHDQHWASPQAYDATPVNHHEAFGEHPSPDAEGKENSENSSGSGSSIHHSGRKSNIKDAFRTSPSDSGGTPSRSLRPSPPPPPMDGPSTNTTPEKLKPRSPFRSPPLSQTKRSPFHGSPTPLGGYGSFGMLDTPGGPMGTLAAEFSPMGPVLNNPFATGFGEHPTPPQLSLSRSNSEDDLGADEEGGSNLSLATSPFSGFIKGFTGGHLPPKNSGGLQGVSRSPLLSERRLAQATASDPRSDRPTTQVLTSTQPNNVRRPRDPISTTKIMASPMEHSSGAKPRKLWNGPGESAGPMRLELGSTSSLKKSFEGINSMMRAGAASTAAPAAAPAPSPVTMATPTTAPRGAPPLYSQYPPPPPHASYRRLNTPMKLEPSPVQTSKAPTGLATIGNKRASASAVAPFSAVKSARDGKVPRTGGKENVTVTTPAQQPQQKRSPCNCKKSRCLKLYCECFAGELFCEGCNCADCQNTPDHSQIRDKAIKDTRAKNPNAFKPRITVKAGQVAVGSSPQSGHNMGCRCKRSECLKKYCECFQNSVMCGSKCKCVECANFAGSQKLIDKRRKMKDARGAEQAMKAGFDSWKGHQNSGRKQQHVARPAAHSMRPMPSPMGTPSMMPPHMMHPSPSGHPGAHPHYMRPMHPFIGYSPLGMPPHHVSPSHFGMYQQPQHPQQHRPPPTPASAQKKSPTNSAMKPPTGRNVVKTPSSVPSSIKKETPSPQPQESSPKADATTSPLAQPKNDNENSAGTPVDAKKNEATDDDNSRTPIDSKKDETSKSVVIKESPEGTANASPKQQPSLFEKVLANARASPIQVVKPTPKDKPGMTVQPTPADTMTTLAAITPATPASPLVTRQSALKQPEQDAALPYFGSLPKLPQTAALKVFSFLSESEIGTGATLVCKQWNHLLTSGDEGTEKSRTN